MTLLIMAAGMGSRFGGVKQIQPVGANGELIIDYSIHDAIAAGFTRVVFVIRRELEQDFCEAIFNRIKSSGKIKAEYVFQDMKDLPKGFNVPSARTKPWGTGHAVLAARNIIKEPFCVINADDFYGPDGFRKILNFFKAKATVRNYCLIGYKLVNTLSAQGTVSRGVCEVNSLGQVINVKEYRKVMQVGNTVQDMESGTVLPPDTDVSVNFFGFTPDVFELLGVEFVKFLDKNQNSETAEFWLPVTIGDLIKSGHVSVQLLTSKDAWLGITYRDEVDRVKTAIAKMKYPRLV